ncbi:MAG: hypothetical protein LBQ62_00025 [Candidatus Accumulibacter sp.]|jgi:hypothetical protein|nr:hypothetical protein [Accumulibacter sp.]
MRKLILFLILSGVAIASQGTPMPEQTRKDFISSGTRSCLAKQRQDPMSEYMTESQRSEYCQCVMTRASEFITLEDLKRFLQTKSNAHFVPIVENAADYCIQMLVKKWGYLK